MKSSRRRFLRNTSIAGTSLVFLSAQKKSKQREIVSCMAPESITALTGTIRTVKSGKWSDATIWNLGRIPKNTDTPLVAKGHNVTFDVAKTTVSGLNIAGNLIFNPAKSATLETNKNVIVNGSLKMYPNTFSVVHTLRFINVDETQFVGATMDPIDSDVGLWVTGAGVLDVSGTPKNPWTRASDSVKAGANWFDFIFCI